MKPVFVKLLIVTLAISCPAMAQDEQHREFKLEKDYFRWLAAKLEYYPFTTNLEKIDEGISGEYSYCWSIGSPQPRHIIQAACLDANHDDVLLAWWRSRDRGTRTLALAVFYCTRVTDIGTFLRFDSAAERFREAEEKARREELVFVKDNITFFRMWFADLTSDTLPEECEFLMSLKTPRKI